MLDALFQFAEGFKAASDLYLALMVRDEETIQELRAALKSSKARAEAGAAICEFLLLFCRHYDAQS